MLRRLVQRDCGVFLAVDRKICGREGPAGPRGLLGPTAAARVGVLPWPLWIPGLLLGVRVPRVQGARALPSKPGGYLAPLACKEPE